MRVLKTFFSIVVLIIIVGIFAVGSLYYFVDPDKLKPVIIEEVKNKTGYQLTIDGKLSWSLYPSFSVKADHLQLFAPNEAKAFLDANGVYIAANLIDLWKSRETLQGQVSISSLKLVNVSLEDVSSNISSQSNEVIFDSIKAKLYGGSLQGVVAAKNVAVLPEWEWDANFKNVQLNPLLKDLNGAESKINVSGVGTFSIQAKTKGKTREALLGQLNGNAVYQIEDGVVDGIDLNYFVQLADASLKKSPTDKLVNTNQTTFNRLNGSFKITNGEAITKNTVLTASSFTTNSQGSIALLSRKLDFAMQIRPTLQDAKLKWDIPVLLSGDLNRPDVRLDVLAVQKMIAGEQIEKLREKASAEIQKHIPGKAGEFLQKLIGN